MISEALDSTHGDRAIALDQTRSPKPSTKYGIRDCFTTFPVMAYLVGCIPSLNTSYLAEA